MPFSLIHFLLVILTTPVSEITTLSLESNTNVPPSTITTITTEILQSTSLPQSPPLLPPSSSSSTEIDVTTISNEHQHDDSLKVLPLKDMMIRNKTNLSNENIDDEEDSTVFSTSTSSSSPMTVNFFDETKIIKKPEMIHSSDVSNDDKMIGHFVNNDADNQMSPMHETNEGNHPSDVIMEKEGRAINFPLEILSSNNQNSTESGHMQINYVTTSTDKPHIMSFFDLSDVSMDRDDDDDDDKEKISDEYSNMKKDKKQFVSKDKIDGDKKNECSFNGTIYKVRFYFIFNIELLRICIKNLAIII